MTKISVLVPAYLESENLPRLVEEIEDTLQGEDFEVIIINDCCTGGGAQVAGELATRYRGVKCFFFGRRQGKTKAIKEGFKRASGEILVIIDADLQFSPKDIPKLINSLKRADVVNGLRVGRKDNVTRKIESRIYNFLVRLIFHTRFHDCNSGLKVLKRKVMKDLVNLLEDGWHRYLLVLATESGYRVAEIPISHYSRTSGRSKYLSSPVKLIRGFRDLLLVKAFVSKHMHNFPASTKPKL